jgi:hypothetical protein
MKEDIMKTWKLGPSGGPGDGEFADDGILQDSRVSRVWIGIGRLGGDTPSAVAGVQIVHELADGTAQSLGWHGIPRVTSNLEYYVIELGVDEYIIGIHGTYGFYGYDHRAVHAIQIETNWRFSQDYGDRWKDGYEYHYEAPKGTEIVGFWGQDEFKQNGWAGVDAIGVILRKHDASHIMGPRASKSYFKCGPYGCATARLRSQYYFSTALPEDSRVASVRIRCNDLLDAIELVHELPDGTTASSGMHGGGDGNLQEFDMGADEYITGISGTVNSYGEINLIRIHTNKKPVPEIFGDPSGGKWEYLSEAPDGTEIGGFFGYAEEKVYAIGVILRERNTS